MALVSSLSISDVTSGQYFNVLKFVVPNTGKITSLPHSYVGGKQNNETVMGPRMWKLELRGVEGGWYSSTSWASGTGGLDSETEGRWPEFRER